MKNDGILGRYQGQQKMIIHVAGAKVHQFLNISPLKMEHPLRIPSGKLT